MMIALYIYRFAGILMDNIKSTFGNDFRKYF